MNISIYRFFDIRNPKGASYIGQTNCFSSRISGHISEARNGHQCHKCNLIRKIGYDNVCAKILEVCKNNEEANNREIYWIAEFKKFGFNLANQSLGGNSPRGYKHTLETRKKMGDAKRNIKQSPEYIEKRIAPLRGRKYIASVYDTRRKPHSKEHNQKISAARLGYHQTEQTCSIISELVTERFSDPFERQKHSKILKDFYQTEQGRKEAEKRKNHLKQFYQTEQGRKIIENRKQNKRN